MRRAPLALIVIASAAAGCEGCFPQPGTDGGVLEDAGSSGGGSSSSSSGGGGDGGRRDGGRADGGDGGSGCGPSTPGFGEACGDCGFMICGRTGDLVCADPGKNACDVCGQLDTSGGIVGRTCGSCGIVGCADGGLVTECQGEHPPNLCGGCEDLPATKGPPDAGCSACETGTWNCTSNLNDLVCWEGRGNTACGGCGRCIQYWADLEDLSMGAFIRTGTRAIIEDVGVDADMSTFAGQTKLLSFQPLVTGPAGLVMESALVYLSPTQFHNTAGAFALSPLFSAYSFGELGDPVRQYPIYASLAAQLPNMQYVLIYDGFVNQVVARGRLQAGAPPGP